MFTITYLPTTNFSNIWINQKLSKQNMKQINTIHVTLPLLKEKKDYEIKLSFAIMNNFIPNNNVKSNQINKEQ